MWIWHDLYPYHFKENVTSFFYLEKSDHLRTKVFKKKKKQHDNSKFEATDWRGEFEHVKFRDVDLPHKPSKNCRLQIQS